MQPGVFLAILGLWILIIGAVGVFIIRRIRHEGKSARESRPEYSFGNSIHEWERACRKSYDWSHSRRNGHKTKEEVKS